MRLPEIESALDRIPGFLVVLLALLLVALIGWADYLDGYYMSFSLFYLLPITLVAAKMGRRGGIAMSILATAVLFVIEESLRPGEMRLYALIWNTVLRLGFFLLIVLVQAALQEALLRIEEANRRLTSANNELAAVNEELSAFTRASAHDLRSPLVAIKGFADRLIRRQGGRPAGEVRRSLEAISSSAQHISELLSAMLSFARAGKAEIRRVDVALSPMANQIADRLAATDGGRKVEFKIEPGIVANADPDLIYIVLDNLLGNAWKFSSGTPAAVIEFGVIRDEAGSDPPVFYVRDNGIGLDITSADKLFTPFTRLHPAWRFEGSGIGLSTVKRIIERHRGCVWVEGAPDRGATFYFTLAEKSS
jgi:signal transduction histidine kinase